MLHQYLGDGWGNLTGEYFGLDNHTVESNKGTKHGF